MGLILGQGTKLRGRRGKKSNCSFPVFSVYIGWCREAQPHGRAESLAHFSQQHQQQLCSTQSTVCWTAQKRKKKSQMTWCIHFKLLFHPSTSLERKGADVHFCEDPPFQEAWEEASISWNLPHKWHFQQAPSVWSHQSPGTGDGLFQLSFGLTSLPNTINKSKSFKILA